MKEISAGGIIVNKNKIVLVRQKRGYSFPKGHVEEGETLLDCAYREIHEEAGFAEDELELVRELGYFTRPDGGSGNTKDIHLFLFTTEKTGLTPADTRHEAIWADMEDVPSMLYPKDREFYESYQKTIQLMNGCCRK